MSSFGIFHHISWISVAAGVTYCFLSDSLYADLAQKVSLLLLPPPLLYRSILYMIVFIDSFCGDFSVIRDLSIIPMWMKHKALLMGVAEIFSWRSVQESILIKEWGGG